MNNIIRPARDYRALKAARRRERNRILLTIAYDVAVAGGFILVLACLVGIYILLAA